MSTYKEKAEKKLNEWKSLAEDLNVQLHLGTAEAKEEFENQKSNLNRWMQETKEKLSDTVSDISEEKATKLKSSIEELQLQAALGKAETESELKEQQKKIALGIHDVKQQIAEASSSSKDYLDDFKETASDALDNFHTRFDLFKVQLHLGKEEGEEFIVEKKKELATKLTEIKSRIELEADESEDKWEDFKKDISEKWNKIRNS